MAHVDGRALRTGWMLSGICTLYLISGVAFALRTPEWQNPDEPAHHRFIERILTERTLPEADIHDPNGYEVLQPPVYYIVVAPVTALADHSSVRATRVATLVFGIPLIVLTFSLALSCLPSGIVGDDRQWTALAATLFAALLPQQVAVAASINNDVAGALASIAVISVAWRWKDGPRSVGRSILFGAICGLALLTKLTTIPAVIVALIIFAGREIKSRTSTALLATIVTCLTIAPWMIANQLRYGDPLGESTFHRFASDLFDLPRFGHEGHGLGVLVRDSFVSFWGYLGWLESRAPTLFYALAAAISIVAIVGVLLHSRSERRLGRAVLERGLFVMTGWLALQLLFFAGFNAAYFQPQGRYLFPALPAIAILGVVGLRYWLAPSTHAPERGKIVFASLGAFLIMANATFHLVVVPDIPRGPCPACPGGRLLESARD